MIRGNAGRRIAHERLSHKPRCVALYMQPLRHRELIIDPIVPQQHAGNIHHLGQAQHPRVLQERCQILRRKRRPGILQRRGGDAGRQHEIHIQRQLPVRPQHIKYPFQPGHIGNLVRVGDHGRRPLRHHGPRKLQRAQHRTLDMHMAVNEARRHISAAHIDLLASCIAADTGYPAGLDGDIRREEFPREAVEHLPILQDQLRRHLSLRHLYKTLQLILCHFFPLSPFSWLLPAPAA